jgi:hypothetical protein
VCRGSIDRDGTLVDPQGVCRGHFDVQGQFWDEQGIYRGYLAPPDGIPGRRANPCPAD